MERRLLTFEESVQRQCSLRLAMCGGPTSNGVDGYVCENCLVYIAGQFTNGQSLSEQRCGYCSNNPTFVGVRGAPICQSCARQALTAARHWYYVRGDGAGA
jgi:hypothetical protein